MDWKRGRNVERTRIFRVGSPLVYGPFAEPLVSTVGVDNTARVTEEQLRNFLVACRAKYVKAKIEPGTFLLLISVPR